MRKILFVLGLLLAYNSTTSSGMYKYMDTDLNTEVNEHKTTKQFMDSVAWSESRMKIDVVNKYGMLGKYQFSRTTLNGIGYKHVTSEEFLRNETIQDDAMKELMRRNSKTLKRIIKKYEGKTINGIEITHSGILAAAHLAGAGNVKRWFRTNGKQTRVDGFGTSIETYMKKFANYKIEV